MAILFFKPQKKARKFNYKPLYYDIDKDEEEKAARLSDDKEAEKLRVRIRRSWEINPKRKKGNIFPVRVLIYIIIVAALAYWIFFT